jgi:2'-5' RNA ligase
VAGRRRLRCFVACFLRPESAAALAALVPEWPGCRRVPAENLHVTLHFVGTLAPYRNAIGDRNATGDRSAAGLAAFAGTLGGVPTVASVLDVRRLPPRQPRALVAVLKVDARLEGWRTALLEAWPTAERDREFLPHVTLMRGRGVADAEDLPDLTGFVVDLSAPLACSSETRPDGARYRPLG